MPEPHHRRPRDLKVAKGDEHFAYSSGALVEALQSAGVPTEDAIKIVSDVEDGIRERKLRRIELAELLDLLAEGAERAGGELAAERLRRQTPPFVPLTVVSDRGSSKENRRRFSRRTLTASLEKLGLRFKEARAAAVQVEQAIRTDGIDTLSQVELARRVASAVEVRHGREARLRYEAQTHRPFEIRVSNEDGSEFPYSRGILARSLMTIGLEPDFSHNLAKRVEEALYALDVDSVSSRDVLQQVAALLRQEAGEEFARRYLVMRQMHHTERPVMVLIGGAPGVGKSAIAAEVGYRLGIPRVVSTDIVRQALRSLIGKELSPVLHASSYAAWRAELLPTEQDTAKPSKSAVLRGFLAQVRQLNPAIGAIIERSISEDTSLVIEGVHLVPGSAPSEEFPGAIIIRLMLFINDPDDHRQHFGTREMKTGRRLARPYLEQFEEIRILDEYIHERSSVEGVMAVDAADFDAAVERCVEHVLDILLMEQKLSDERAATSTRAS